MYLLFRKCLLISSYLLSSLRTTFSFLDLHGVRMFFWNFVGPFYLWKIVETALPYPNFSVSFKYVY